MTETYIVAVSGLDDVLNSLEEITPAVKRSLLRAVNFTTTRGRTRASREIRNQVAFPASYLSPSGGRLVAIPTKDKDNPTGYIRARTEATSLARLTKAKPLRPTERRPKRGIRLTVKPGVARYTDSKGSGLNGAFILPLSNSNLGLAVRSDSAPKGAFKPKKMGKNLWLLYGPSVSQILYSARNNGGVADDIQPDLEALLLGEFNRQMELTDV